MRKLLFLMFAVALLSLLSVDAFAKWGKTVTVSNDTELIAAMDDKSIEEIILAPGHYAYLEQLITEESDTRLIRTEPSSRADCDYFIQVANFCQGDYVITSVRTIEGVPGGCSTPNQGVWSILTQVPGSTIELRTNIYPFNVLTPGVGPHPYIIQFEADLPGEYVLRYDFPDGQFVQGNYFVREIPEFEVSQPDPVCLEWEDECADFEFVLTVTRNLGLPVQSQALPPYSIQYTVDGSGPYAVTIVAADETAPGSGIYTKTLDFCYEDCGIYEFVFTFLESNNNNCGGTVIERDVEIYDAAVFDNPEDQEVCGLEATFFLCEYINCLDEENYGWEWTWTGPLGAPDPVFTKLNGNGPEPVAVGACEDEWKVEVEVCGEYTFTYWVTNGPCVTSTSFTVKFYDEAEFTIDAPTEVCGLETSVEVCAEAECILGEGLLGTWVVKDEWGYQVTAATVIPGEDDCDWDIAVPYCGTFTFEYTVENGPCTSSTSFVISFYDTPVIYMQDDGEVCALDYCLEVDFSVACEHEDLDYGWFLHEGPVDATATFVGDCVTVSECGTYVFGFYVENGFGTDECYAVDYVTITFYTVPTIEIEEVDDVCLNEEGIGFAALTATITYDVDACQHPEAIGYWGVKSPAPGGVTWLDGDNTSPEATAIVDACGEYTFVYTVENGPCPPVTAFVVVNFYDLPVGTAYYEEEVCGFETGVEICVDVECLDGEAIIGGTWTVTEALLGAMEVNVPGGVMIADAIAEECDFGFDITVPECGVYTFTYTFYNGDCPGSVTFTITFYEAPEPVIDGPDVVSICEETTFELDDLTDCYLIEEDVLYTWSIDPVEAGYFIGSNEGTTVTIGWNYLGSVTVKVVATIGELEDCMGEDEFEVEVVAPLLAGQVKYWNQFETYMPTPFPTKDYATYPHDYFYVTLGWGFTDEAGGFVGVDSLTTVKVEPRLMEDLVELMSYFEFELEDYAWLPMEFQGGDFCEGWFLKIWDGGLVYYDLPGGFPINPPQAARHLGNNYTYNNWGGVNATDALAIQIMATQMPINSAPYNFAWVGDLGWNPRYGYYSHSAADVNSSNPYINGGITALDALTTNYRAVGLLDVFPNSQPSVQYSPNFRVTGRMVPSLPYMTWDEPFDYIFNAGMPVGPTDDNPDDVPFFHSGFSYLYFTPAWYHKYTSTPISLSDKNFINIYYLALGDINSSYVPTSGGFKAEPAMALNYDGEQVVSKGEIVTVPIRIDRNAELGAISLDLSYNTSLIEVIGVNYDEDYFMIDAEAGILRVMWFSHDAPVNFAFGEAIVNVQVRVLGNITADTRFFELEANTELADRNAQPYKNINLETTALSSVESGLFMTNYPNPFRSTTMISYSIPEAGNVSLVVYNKLGQVVETLVSARQDAGTYQVEFGRTDLTPGAYFYRIIVEGETNTYTSTNSMIFMQ